MSSGAQTGSLITRELRTDSINVGAIARGEVPGWMEIDVTDGSTARAMMSLAISSAYGDEDDFEEATPPEPASSSSG
jgi:hypothetical protein